MQGLNRNFQRSHCPKMFVVLLLSRCGYLFIQVLGVVIQCSIISMAIWIVLVIRRWVFGPFGISIKSFRRSSSSIRQMKQTPHISDEKFECQLLNDIFVLFYYFFILTKTRCWVKCTKHHKLLNDIFFWKIDRNISLENALVTIYLHFLKMRTSQPWNKYQFNTCKID